MSATAPIVSLGMTAEELFELPDDGMRHELVEGELRAVGVAPALIGARDQSKSKIECVS